MENITDALYMASAVLVLIIALSISISSFSTTKEQIEEIISTDDAIDMAKYDGKYINYIEAVEQGFRVVNYDSLISTIRRLKVENYVIYIKPERITKWEEAILDPNDDNKKYYYVIENDYVKISLSNKGNQVGQVINDVIMNDIYRKLVVDDRATSFNEYIGIYQNNEEISESNKETFRVITFEEILS